MRTELQRERFAGLRQTGLLSSDAPHKLHGGRLAGVVDARHSPLDDHTDCQTVSTQYPSRRARAALTSDCLLCARGTCLEPILTASFGPTWSALVAQSALIFSPTAGSVAAVLQATPDMTPEDGIRK